MEKETLFGLFRYRLSYVWCFYAEEKNIFSTKFHQHFDKRKEKETLTANFAQRQNHIKITQRIAIMLWTMI